jgi:hypothetical protein
MHCWATAATIFYIDNDIIIFRNKKYAKIDKCRVIYLAVGSLPSSDQGDRALKGAGPTHLELKRQCASTELPGTLYRMFVSAVHLFISAFPVYYPRLEPYQQ